MTLKKSITCITLYLIVLVTSSCGNVSASDKTYNYNEMIHQGTDILQSNSLYPNYDYYHGIEGNQYIPYYQDETLGVPNKLFESSRYLSYDETYDHEEMLFNSKTFTDYIEGTGISREFPYKITKAERVIQCNKQLVKVVTKMTIKRLEKTTLQHEPQSVTPFYFLLPVHESIQMFGFKVKNLSTSEIYQTKVHKDYQIRDFDYSKKNPLPAIQSIDLKEPENDGGSTWISFEYYLGRPYTPMPEEQDINDPQSVELPTYSHLLSPYKIDFQVTLIISETKNPWLDMKYPENIKENIKIEDNSIKVGPLLDTPSYNLGYPIKVKFLNTVSLPLFSQASKTIRISPWGWNTEVAENYTVHNEAAHLKGPFIRSEIITKMDKFRGKHMNPPPSYVLSRFDAYFPSSLISFEYFDVNGNVSNSATFTNKNNHKIEINPRYPILGGWKAIFNFIYRLPFNQYLHDMRHGAHYFNIPLSPSIPEVYIDNYKFEVKLPFGARNIRYDSPITPISSKVTHYQDWFQIFSSPKLELEFCKVMIKKADSSDFTIMIKYDSNTISDMFSITFTIIIFLLILYALYLAFSGKSLRILHKDGIKITKKNVELESFKTQLLTYLEDIIHSYGVLTSYIKANKSNEVITTFWHNEKYKFSTKMNNMLEKLSDSPPQLKSLNQEISEIFDVLFKLAPKEASPQVTNCKGSGKQNSDNSLEKKFSELDQKISSLFFANTET